MSDVRFTGRVRHIKLNYGKFTKDLDEALKVLVRNAARAWLRAVIIKVGTYTGETKGSIKFAAGPAGNLAQFLRVSVPINAPFPRRKKNQQTGARKGRFNFTSGRHVYQFYFRSNVIQYYLREFFDFPDDRSATTPYASRLYGSQAYNQIIRLGMLRLPKVNDKKYTISQTI